MGKVSSAMAFKYASVKVLTYQEEQFKGPIIMRHGNSSAIEENIASDGLWMTFPKDQRGCH